MQIFVVIKKKVRLIFVFHLPLTLGCKAAVNKTLARCVRGLSAEIAQLQITKELFKPYKIVTLLEIPAQNR